jgi:tripartite-type tricarboxylate transporter receptor subunit TctC
MTTRRLLLGAALATSAFAPAFAQAPAWPQRSVRFVVAFAPGGVVDQIGRLLAEHLGEIWGQPVVVENRPGAGGNVGTQFMTRATPDGYSALVNSSTYATNLSLFQNPGYREEDFATAAVVAGTPQLLVVRADSPFRTLADLVEMSRRRPVTYGTPGVGSPNQFLTELLFRRAGGGAEATHVPYGGAGPAMQGVLAGDIDVAAAAVASAMTHVRGGRARGLAVMAERRSQALPDVPTVAEAGFEPLVDTVWAAVFFPAGTPRAVLERTNADIGRVMQRPAFQQRLAATGFEPIGGDLATTQRFVASEIAKWRDIVRTLGVQAR